MANLIEAVSVSNPSGVVDVCSHIRTDAKSTLVISNCMPYIGTYAFRFWIRSTLSQTISFTCDTTYKTFPVSKDWSCFQVVFTVGKISNIYLEFPKGQYWIYNTKLEYGEHFTDWSPHPEDGITAYDDKIADLEQTLIAYQSEIKRTQSYVDQVQQQIINSVSKTTYEAEISGLTQSISDKFTNIEDGYNNWYVSFFDKSQFKDTKLDDDMDDRERHDMAIFMLDNANLNPVDEQLIPDKPAEMRVNGKGKVIYYLAFAKFSEETVINTQINYNRASLYLNGIQIFTANQPLMGTTSVLLNFTEGWNIIEIVSNEGNLAFTTRISRHENCELFNCLMGVPTQRTVRIREQGAYLNIYLDKIVSEVFENVMEDVYDDDGNVIRRRKALRSKIEQAKDAIKLLVESSSTDEEGHVTSLTLTDRAIQAITEQFVVTGTNGHDVVIEDGQVLADSISADMIKTDAIMSRNYIPSAVVDPNAPKFAQQGTFVDTATGNVYTPNLYIDGENNKAYFKGTVHATDGEFTGTVYANDGVFKGTIYANDGVFNGTVYADDGVFNGTVYAENGVFNGTVYATDGRFTGELYSNKGKLGAWILTNTSLYKGSPVMGTHGNGNIYLGDDGISLSDRLIYDSATESLMFAPSAITFAGRDIDAEVSGQKAWYSTGQPSYAKYPANLWDTAEKRGEHVGNYYYDSATGRVYVYKTAQDVLYKITFDEYTDIKANDYVAIYYRYNDQIYRVAEPITQDNSPDIKIPADYFYLHWHRESGGVLDHYGFAITSFDRVPLDEGPSLAIGGQNLPGFSVDASVTPGTYPATDHPYQSVDDDKIWLIRAGSSEIAYEWEEVHNQAEIEAIAENAKTLDSFIHYDPRNGLMFYHSSANLPNRILTKQDLDHNTALKSNLRITENGMGVYNRNTLLAMFGSTIQFFEPGTNVVATDIDANGLNIRQGTISIGSLNSLNFDNSGQSGFYVANDGKFTAGNANAYMKFDGTNFYLRAKSITFGSDGYDLEDTIAGLEEGTTASLQNFITNTYNVEIEQIKRQSDKKMETYSSEAASDPALSWDNDEKPVHVGDIWHNLTTDIYYQYVQTSDGYAWQEMRTRPPEGLMDRWDGKSRIFAGDVPEPPYDIGDSWVNAVYPAEGDNIGSVYNNDMLRCVTSKAAGETFAIGDWILATKYTDDTRAIAAVTQLNTFINGQFQESIDSIREQADAKMQTWRAPSDEDPADNWTTADDKALHEGDMWFDTTNNVYKQYVKVGNVYRWEEMRVNPPDEVFDAIDGKCTIYVSIPTPPYNEKDLWVNAIYPTEGQNMGSLYYNDILRCVHSASAGELFDIDDWELASNYTDDTAANQAMTSLNNFINGDFQTTISQIKTQSDQKMQTWRQASAPSTNWTTDADKAKHEGDIWYDTTNNVYKQYIKGANDTYSWVEMLVNPPQAVFDKIDGKCAVFVAQPTPPYNERDLWVNATYPASTGAIYNNEILKCVQSRTTGQSFDISDWIPASCYTDDSALEEFKTEYDATIRAIQNQSDSKAQTWAQEADPSTENTESNPAWSTTTIKEMHVGDIWFKPSTGVYKMYSNSYAWEEMRTKPPQEFIDELDRHRAIFVAEPRGPYEVGDIWVNAVYPATGTNAGSIYNNEILRCTTSRSQENYFSIDDWVKSNKYTDDTVANQKSTTWVQTANPANAWTTDALKEQHIGDVWVNPSTARYYVWNGTLWNEIRTGNYNMFMNGTDGLVIHHNDASVNSVANVTGGNIRLTDSGLGIYNNNKMLTEYGATTYYYYYDGDTKKVAAELGTAGLSIKNGSITLGTPGNSDYMYFGPLGLSLYNKLTYNPTTNALTLNVDSLNIGNATLGQAIKENVSANGSYYGTVVPSNSNYPASVWIANNEMYNHVGDLYYDTATGKVYRYQQRTDRKFLISFAPGTEVRNSNDYARVYYYFNQQLRHLDKVQIGIQFSVPTENFYVYWHNDKYTGNNYYGTNIYEVLAQEGNNYSSYYDATSLPDYPIEYVGLSNLPTTSHPYKHDVRVDKLWYVESGLGIGNDYEWREIQNSEILSLNSRVGQIQSYLHYDSTNGLMLYNGGSTVITGGTATQQQLESLNGNIRLTASGMGVYKGNKILAEYGDSINFYKYDGDFATLAATIDSSGFHFNIGSVGDCSLVNGVLKIKNANIESIDASKITAGSLTIGMVNGLQSQLNSLSTAANGYTNYITQIDGGGIKVHDANNTSDYVQITSDETGFFRGGTQIAGIGAQIWLGSQYLDGLLLSSTSISLQMGRRDITIDGSRVRINTSNESLTGTENRIEFASDDNIFYAFKYVSSQNPQKLISKIDWTGNMYLAGTLTQASDEKFKKILKNKVIDYKDILMQIEPIAFRWRDKTREQTTHFGVGASAVQKILDEDNITDLSIVSKNNDGDYTICYQELFMISLAVTQQHENEIKELKAELQQLKSQIANLSK